MASVTFDGVAKQYGKVPVIKKLDPHGAPKMGALVELIVELDALHLFDAEDRAASRRVIPQPTEGGSA